MICIRPIHEQLLMESQIHDHAKMFYFDIQANVKNVSGSNIAPSRDYENRLFYKA